jgi:hypothetical protein
MARQDLFFFSLFFFRSPPASYMEGMYMEGTSLTPSLQTSAFYEISKHKVD